MIGLLAKNSLGKRKTLVIVREQIVGFAPKKKSTYLLRLLELDLALVLEHDPLHFFSPLLLLLLEQLEGPMSAEE